MNDEIRRRLMYLDRQRAEVLGGFVPSYDQVIGAAVCKRERATLESCKKQRAAAAARRKAKKDGSYKPSPWVKHYQKYAKEHGVSMRQAMIDSKHSYKKKKRTRKAKK